MWLPARGSEKMTKDIIRNRILFYQIFTRFLPYYNQYIEIDIYHFTVKCKEVYRKISFWFKIWKIFYFYQFPENSGKMVKFSQRIAKGYGKNLGKNLGKCQPMMVKISGVKTKQALGD